VVNLETLLFPLLLVAAALELGRNLVGPALKTGVDGLEVNARIPAAAAAGARNGGR